ncbi:metallophosphoesterase [Paracoccus sp. 1_MG-2023]|uniref:metallophosphoesterase family protein n=1 Tax=unclassified Paracoccus (in: a-proteobacteria) TaxID=2688777 RepID=UPI001C07F85C|nr:MULTISPECIES: metallophosphoesterase [unclassified Paracoccus (in: a-proteobacteria)]MBU2957719.1 metallophosphoesterase [Paracoccus sp. C2R09]MDO6667433.1 metallophosphoesterase [Paracoccus sp. 1_MG-2023]
MPLRFIHSSDLHIGRKFASIPQPADGNIRGRLMEARHGAIARLAQVARDKGAAHILLAGDIFDTPTPSPGIAHQAAAAMAEAGHVTWWLLPGNHDNLRDAEPLWDMIRGLAVPNIRVLSEAVPVVMQDGATLLPCPVRYRAGATDPSAPMVAMASGEGDLRIGLAHGGVTDFTESGDVIAPDRDRSARLDYLALGDWHGRMRVSARVHYSGSPEQDRFKHGTRGTCLCVTLDGPGAEPQVEEIETGHFHWLPLDLPLHPGQDAAAALLDALPRGGRRDILIRVALSGWARLGDRAALIEAAERVGPEFAHFEMRLDALGTEYDQADLDRIDRKGGALRIAAEDLATEAESDAPAPQREAAKDALARLYAYVRESAE